MKLPKPPARTVAPSIGWWSRKALLNKTNYASFFVSSKEVPGTSITDRDPDVPGIYWRYPNTNTADFNPIVFDETRLAEQNLISGQARAGRGNTFFVNLEGHALVLRHYRRGGMVQRVSSNRYVFTGLSRTRAMLEFDILQKMHNMQLPVPKPFACRVIKHCATYEASIVTHRLQGHTLAHLCCSTTLSDQQWNNIGSTIARFHKEGIDHADLNAHNILLNDEGLVSLIDFDRARFRPVSAQPSSDKWCASNLDRLWRSLEKVAKNPQGEFIKTQLANSSTAPANVLSKTSSHDLQQGFELLKSSWVSAKN
jgi:3-deoxy-D-manno-octulosonic acid kinase